MTEHTERELFEWFAKKSRGRLIRACGADWEDVLHDAFIPFLLAYREGLVLSVEAYWQGITNNVERARLREVVFRRNRLTEVSELLADHGPNPEQVAVGNEAQHKARRVLEILPLPYRQVLTMKAVGMSDEEIMLKTGMNKHQVRNNAHRGRRAAARQFQRAA